MGFYAVHWHMILALNVTFKCNSNHEEEHLLVMEICIYSNSSCFWNLSICKEMVPVLRPSISPTLPSLLSQVLRICFQSSADSLQPLCSSSFLFEYLYKTNPKNAEGCLQDLLSMDVLPMHSLIHTCSRVISVSRTWNLEKITRGLLRVSAVQALQS